MIEGYVGRESVTAGEVLRLHVSTDAEEFRVRFHRLGRELAPMGESGPYPGVLTAPPPHPDGVPEHASPAADWEFPAYEFAVPEEWPPGIYLAHLVPGDERAARSVPVLGDDDIEGFAREFFVVRPRHPGSHGRILYKKSTFTRHAYNRSDNEGAVRDSNLYENPVYQEGGDGEPRGHKLSMRRPGGVIDLAWWDAPFIAWLERSGYAVEYCTDLDLHEDPHLLAPYDLLLSVGHDEYWSDAMRDQVAAYVSGGGNVAFLSANTCWWRVHLTDGNTAFVSDTDHRVGEDYPHLPATDLWWPPPPEGVGRPENTLTGVTFRNGGMWPGEWPGDRPREGYTVQHADHWVFEGTGLRDGGDGGPPDRLGAGTALIGYECDGAAFAYDEHGVARASGVDGTPESFLILGIYLLDPVHENFHHLKWGHWNCPEREPAITSPRAATMGIHTAGGTVFTAGTVDWPVVCGRELDAGVVRVTRNVLDRLSHRVTEEPGGSAGR
ncbi:N,N-dimethylformamidase beta subunit family domain-containing protein [Streptomyces yaizuensis]|uniref:GldG family protein n=1 Tax=Streptomyces yaizuensis TaxID=2989713 RepID=A0ABQ5NQR6_9ACTN|nr:N,N-dimethylformamidase beta subunit family domain-containing protein [Streptomyces sp. YSPA8]GLF92702.1 GldG family protein [Streptomyces sp. YSPA8]